MDKNLKAPGTDDKLVWEWVPNISIGHLYFEKKVNIHDLPFHIFELKKPSEDEPWFTYEVKEDNTLFYIENGILTSVECKNNFIYKGLNLIGLEIKKVLKILNFKCSIEDYWDDGAEICCDEVNVILWEENGLITSVSVSGERLI